MLPDSNCKLSNLEVILSWPYGPVTSWKVSSWTPQQYATDTAVLQVAGGTSGYIQKWGSICCCLVCWTRYSQHAWLCICQQIIQVPHFRVGTKVSMFQHELGSLISQLQHTSLLPKENDGKVTAKLWHHLFPNEEFLSLWWKLFLRVWNGVMHYGVSPRKTNTMQMQSCQESNSWR